MSVTDDLTIRADRQALHLFGRTWLMCPMGSCNRIHGHLGHHNATSGRHRPETGRISMSSFLAGLAPGLAAPTPRPQHLASASASTLPGRDAQEAAGGNPGPALTSGVGSVQGSRAASLMAVLRGIERPW